MSGELQFETVYDSGYKPSLESARDVLAFVLTPLDVIGPIEPGERDECEALFTEAKRHAVAEWNRLRSKTR